MSATWGESLQVTIFGESHGPALGVTISGLPAGIVLDEEAIARMLARRKPGQALSTQRKESDSYQVVSGVMPHGSPQDGHAPVTTGAPLTALFQNSDARSLDYAEVARYPRPGHADYAALMRYGSFVDLRGGGRFSGRMTLPLTFAGALCSQVLARTGISIAAYLKQVGQVVGEPFDLEHPPLEVLQNIVNDQAFPALSEKTAALMQDEIKRAASCKDSVGAVIECCAWGVPAGLGGPLFEGIEGKVSSLAFAVPAVKGVSFGAGFALASLRGSQSNDPLRFEGANVVRDSNNMGGIEGGITNGMPLVFQAAFKPTPSLGREQQTVDLKERTTVMRATQGRHDPCVALRAVPVMEAVCAIALCDSILSAGDQRV